MRSKHLLHGILLGVSCLTWNTPCSSASSNPTVTISAGHSDRVSAIVFAPNGQWFATASSDASVKIWDTATGQLIRSLGGHTKAVKAIRPSADGRFVASLADDETIRIWDVVTGECLREVKNVGTGYIVSGDSLVLGKDGLSILSIARSDGKEVIRRWEFPDGVMVGREVPVSGDREALARSPDGSSIAIALKNETDGSHFITIVDEATGKTIRSIQSAHSGLIETIAWSPDGKQIASGSADHTVKLWNVDSASLLRTISFSSFLNSIAYSADGQYLASASHDGVQLWAVGDGQLVRTFGQAKTFSTAVAFSPDGNLLASADDDRGLVIWRLQSGDLVQRQPQDHYHNASTVAAIADDQWRSVGQGSIASWDLTKGNLISSQPFETSHIRNTQLSADPEAQVLAAIIENSTKINVWDAGSARLLYTLDWGPIRGKDGTVSTLVLSDNGRSLAAKTDEKGGHIKVWDARAGRLLRDVPGHSSDSFPRTIALSSDGTRLASSGYLTDVRGTNAATIRILDIASGRALKTIGQKNSPSDAISFAGDREHLLADDYDGSYQMRYFDLGSGGRIRPLGKADPNPPQIIVHSPKGELIALCWQATSTIEIREVSSGRTLFTLNGNAGLPRSVAFAPGGRRLIVGNANGTNSIWNLGNGQLLATVIRDETGEWLTFTPEGFFTASDHGASIAYVVDGMAVLEIGQFYQSLYRPDLVREKLAGDPRGLVQEAAANLDLNKVVASGSAPEVRLTLPARALGSGNVDGGRVSVEAEITDRGGGIGRVEWRINSVTAGVDTPAPGSAGQPIRLSRNLTLDPGENTIEVVAYNRGNLIASMPSRLNVAVQAASPSIVPSQPATSTPIPAPAPAAVATPRLFVLVAGVNEYADKRFRLSYAVSDAREIARAFQDASGSLYQSVEVKLMTDAEVTRGTLDAAFADMAAKASV